MRTHVSGAALGWLCLACLLVWPSLAPAAEDPLLAAKDEPPVVLRFEWSQRAATEAGFVLQLGPLKLPVTSRSYLKIAETDQARPVFLTGHGRRGTLEFTMKPDRLQGGYAITTRGAPVIEFADESGGPKWRLTVQRVHGATGTEGLRAWLARRHKPMDTRAGESAPPTVRWQAKLDVELRSPTGTVTLRDRPAELTLRVIEVELWGRRHAYWDLTMTTTLPTPTGEIRAVIGTVEWVPKNVLLEGAPELAEMDGSAGAKPGGGEE
jgi:hypothetical protein